MKKNSNSLSKSSLPLNTDRKATIKKYPDIITFPRSIWNDWLSLKSQIASNYGIFYKNCYQMDSENWCNWLSIKSTYRQLFMGMGWWYHWFDHKRY